MSDHVKAVHKEGGMYCSCWTCCLFICERCGLYEGSLTTDCPGVPSYSEHSSAVYAGMKDYRGGQWREGAVSPHCPAGLKALVEKEVS